MAMGEMATMGQIKPQDGVSGIDHRHVSRRIGLGAGVRLHIGVIGAEELPGAVTGKVLNHVGVFTATVIALAWVALGVLIGKDGARSLQYGFAYKVLRGDHFQAFVLASDFVIDGGGDLGIGLG
jgi:hypothetical protein